MKSSITIPVTNHIDPSLFQSLLLNWYKKQGRKHLPWQQDKTPYRVWISEIMLQQTQVTTVIPYYERFMQRFPNLAALANAQEDEVLHLWSGLGYYSRARNLLRASRMIVETYNGIFPHTYEDLLTLPGIGRSTAGAILSLAFNEPTCILDGNVKRVLVRLHAITQAVKEKSVENTLWQLAQTFLPAGKYVASYTQAMMDLGAMVCTPNTPTCEQCPVARLCLGYQQGNAHHLPYKPVKAILPERTATFFIIKVKQEILLCKRPSTGIWGGLWCLPEMAGKPKEATIHDYCANQLGIKIKQHQVLTAFRHTFTHFHLNIHPIVIELKLKNSIKMASSQQVWYNLQTPAVIGLPKPVSLLLKRFRESS